MKRYFRFSFLAVADKNVGQFFGQTPTLFLGRWGGPEQVAFLNVSAKVFTILAAFHGAVSRAYSVRLFPGAGERRPGRAARRLFWRTSLAWGGISCLIAAVLFLCLPIFRLIYGPENIPSTLLVVLLGLLMAKQGFTVSLGVHLPDHGPGADQHPGQAPADARLAAARRASGAARRRGGGRRLPAGAYLTGDLIYFGLLLTPWFWRAHRHRNVT